jgi:glycosyltransferase involved in cell wall biosynthesis
MQVNQAMKLGVPVVATSIAVEGMYISDEVECLIADSPQAFAKKIVEVYTNCELWGRLVRAANSNIKKHFNTNIARVQVRNAVQNLGVLTADNAHNC